MIYVQLFMAFFFPGVLGYGGGPASIPLIEHEVVDNYHWMSTTQFSEVLALGNALPGPIATKMAGYIGFEVAGVIGAMVALGATVLPSLLLMVLLLGILYKNRESIKVKRLTVFVLPTVAVLLGVLTFDFFNASYHSVGMFNTIVIAIASYLLLERWKVHPAFVIVGGLCIGALFLGR